MTNRQLRRADLVHHLAITALMTVGIVSSDSWLLAVGAIVAYFVAIFSETLLYCEARDWSDEVRP